MPLSVTIPALGESITEVKILRWLKKEGDAVHTDEPLCELETDKANVELPSPGNGIIKGLSKEGAVLKIGDVACMLQEGANDVKDVKSDAPKKEASPQKKTNSSSSSSEEVVNHLSPSVRRVVRDLHMDKETALKQTQGSGPHGRIIKEDLIQLAATANPVVQNIKEEKTNAPVVESSLSKVPQKDMTTQSLRPSFMLSSNLETISRVPMTKIRKKIAERLVQAQHQAAMLTTFNEVDMTSVLALKEKYKKTFTETYGVSLGLMSFFCRAVCLGLSDFPLLNASIEEDDVIYHNYIHLGVAVSTERGLIVPVLKHVNQMSFHTIESEIKRMAKEAREGKLGLNELGGGTFTITNGGVFGSLMSTPILNAPQSGILGLHAIKKRPVAVFVDPENESKGEKIELRPMMYMALSYDHRLVDGKDSVSFLVRIKNLIEDPSRLMLEV